MVAAGSNLEHMDSVDTVRKQTQNINNYFHMYSLPNESISVYLFFIILQIMPYLLRLICGSKSYINNKGLPHSQSGALSGNTQDYQ